MDDAVSRYCTATEAGDVDGFMAALAPDVEAAPATAAWLWERRASSGSG